MVRQVFQPASSVRESWLIEPGSGGEHGATATLVGSRAAAVAVSRDGHRVATLQDRLRLRPAGTSVQSGPRRLDTVWVGDVADRVDPGTPVFQLDPPVPT